jgi:hypothetical protein
VKVVNRHIEYNELWYKQVRNLAANEILTDEKGKVVPLFEVVPRHEDELGLKYEVVFRSFRTGRLEREMQMVQLSTIRCSCIAIL